MKITAAYYLLLVYSIAICKPLLPIIKDITAHAFWRADHLSTVHTHSGAQHVHKEISKAAKQENKGNRNDSSKNSEAVSLHIIKKNSYSVFCFVEPVINYPLKVYNLPNTFLEINSPPPRNIA